MRREHRSDRAVAGLAGLTIAAVLVSTAVLLWSLRTKELSHARLETVNLASMLIDQTQQQFESVDQVLQGVQERLSSGFGSQLALNSELTHLLLVARLSGHPQLTSLLLLDPQGRLVNSSHVPDARPRVEWTAPDSTDPAFAAQGRNLAQGVTLGHPRRLPIKGQWTVRMARTLQTPEGQVRGTVVAEIDVTGFESDFYRAKLDFVRPIALYLQDGTLLASWPHRESDLGARAMELRDQQLPAWSEGVKAYAHTSGDGARAVFALGRLKDFPLLLGVTDDEEVSLAAWREIAIPIGLATLLLCGFTVFVAYFMGQKLRREADLAHALSDANNRYLHTVESMKDAIVAVDASLTICLFNPAAQAMFGFSQAEAVGQPLAILLPALPALARQGHDALAMAFAKTQHGPRAMVGQLEIFGQWRDGSEFPIESSISKTEIGGKLQMTAVLRDVTEQRRAKADLQQINTELRALSVAQQTVREDECTRISRELHDDLGQQLTGLKLNLLWLVERMKEGRAVDQEQLDSMRQTLNGAIRSVRRISSELRPVILDELGFADAVVWQTRELAQHSGLQMDVRLGASDRVQGELLSTALFRIVQESLTNVVRHAKASAVEVTLELSAGDLVLRIADNGVGMPVSPQRGGIGMVSMRERARAVGAQLQVLPREGGGTVVEVRLAQQALVTQEGLA